jgi:hypothetical protein
MNERSAEKEGEGFFLNDPRKLLNPFPNLEYFRRIPRLGLDESKEIQWYRSARNRGPITFPLVY